MSIEADSEMMKETISDLRTILNKSKKEIEDSVPPELDTTLEKLEKEVDRKSISVAEFYRGIAECDRRMKKSRKELDSIKAELRRKAIWQKEMDERLDTMTLELSSMNEEIGSMNEEIGRVKEEITDLNRRLDRLEGPVRRTDQISMGKRRRKYEPGYKYIPHKKLK